MSDRDDEARLLNEFFKSLSEVDEESQKWKEYHESCVKFFHLACEFMASRLDIVKTRLYGSSAENLKNYSFDDIGDLDLLLFPGGDYIVDENMLEYLPKDPAYVKIKGTEHPLFQSILAEDTEYVSASDIKEFHPFVDMYMFGFSLLPRVVKAMIARSSVPPPLNCSERERDTDSPATTCDFSAVMESRDIMSRRLSQLKQLKVQNLDPSELEYLPVILCSVGEVEYTPERADVYNDFVQHAKDSVESLCSNPRGILQGIPNFAREIWSSEKAKEIRNRFCNIERGTKIESGSKPGNNKALAVTPEILVVDENVNNSSKCKQVDKSISTTDFAEKASLEQAIAGECGSYDTCKTSKTEPQGHECIAHSDIPQAAQIREAQDTRQDQNDGFFSQSFKWLSEEDMETFLDWLVKEKAEDFFDFLDTVEPVKELLDYVHSPSTDGSQKCTQSMSIDLVPALQARGWPKVAREWINRKRQWPSPGTIHRIIQEGFHLVVKPPKGSDCPETDFRLSFSNAEYLLSKELSDIQRHCYRALKKYYSVYLRTEPKCLVTYHLKTLFLQACEETAAEMWTEENRTACMMELLERLHSALTERYLRHFFITPCNLFDIEYIETPEVLDSLAVKVELFMKNPMEYSQELMPARGTKRSDAVPTPGTNQDQATRQREDVEGSVDDDALPRIDPHGCGQLVVRNEENSLTNSSHEEATRRMALSNDITVYDSQDTGTTNLRCARFHELKDMYLQTCLELITIAVEDRSTKELDLIERSLVEDIKELTRQYNVHPEKLLESLERRWHNAYLTMFQNSEFHTKQSMLSAMRNNMKLIKHVLLRDGPLGSPRDYSLICPADAFVNVYRRCKRIHDSMKPKQPMDNIDDIPLD